MTDQFIDGRRVFLVVAASVVALAGVIGFFVGSNGAEVAPTISVFGLLALPTTPATLTLYGMVLAAVALAVLFGLVTLASRVDDASLD